MALTSTVTVAALIAVVIYFGHFHSHTGSAPPPNLVETPIAQPIQARPSERSSTLPESNPTKKVIEAAQPSQIKDNAPTQPLSAKAKKVDRAHVQSQSKAEISSSGALLDKPIDRGAVSFTARDINDLIEKADKQVGDGNFDAAIGTYTIVLRHDPANVRAKQGIARARKNKGPE